MKRDFSLTTERGDVIGIGRIKIPRVPKLGFDCEIPLLSFVVIEDADGDGFIATCIHMQIDGYGKTIDGAVNDAVNNIWRFLYENFKNKEHREDAWRNVLDAMMSNPRSGALWDKYHIFQIELAKKGKSSDRPTNKYASFSEKNKKLEERAKELEEEVAALKDAKSKLESQRNAAIAALINAFVAKNINNIIMELNTAE
jgi:hypothetical protein